MFCRFQLLPGSHATERGKGAVRTIEKSGIADGDYSMCCTVSGSKVHPKYYGLEMVAAVAFHMQSHRTEIFRTWVIRRATKTDLTRTILLPIPKGSSTDNKRRIDILKSIRLFWSPTNFYESSPFCGKGIGRKVYRQGRAASQFRDKSSSPFGRAYLPQKPCP